MKRILCMLLAVLMLGAPLLGCQETPDSPVVVGKDLDQLLDKAQRTEAVAASTAPPEAPAPAATSATLITNLGIPERLQMESVSAKGKLRVHTDAAIHLPGADKMPVARVLMSRFTNGKVRQIAEQLFEGAEPVSDDLSLLPKAYYNAIMEDLLANKDNEAWFNARYLMQGEYDDFFAAVMQSLADAPSKATYAPLSYQFDEPAEDGKYVHYYAIRENASLSRIHIYTELGFARLEYFRNLDDSCLDILLSQARHSPDSTYAETVPLLISQAEARAMAEDTLQKMGFAGFTCSGMRQHSMERIAPRGVYEFMFTRAVSGVAVTYTDDGGGDRKIRHEGQTFARPWLYEKIRIFLDDEGIAMFEYCSPHDMAGVELDAAVLLPFSTIQAIYEDMIVLVDNEYDTAEEPWTCEYFIDHISLGLMRLTEQDVGSQGLLVPVWDFFGRSVDSYGIERGTSGYTSLLTINAIDGSIIDRYAGY